MVRSASFDYEKLVQLALYDVIKNVLKEVAKKGLPGRHHFYVAFATDHPGVDMPDYLKDDYPEEMTIVLQNEFEDLVVEENRFSVTLCFDNAYERLTIPFESLVSFVDPSVKFALEFTPDYDSFEQTSNNKETEETQNGKNSQASDGSNIIPLSSFRKKTD